MPQGSLPDKLRGHTVLSDLDRERGAGAVPLATANTFAPGISGRTLGKEHSPTRGHAALFMDADLPARSGSPSRRSLSAAMAAVCGYMCRSQLVVGQRRECGEHMENVWRRCEATVTWPHPSKTLTFSTATAVPDRVSAPRAGGSRRAARWLAEPGLRSQGRPSCRARGRRVRLRPPALPERNGSVQDPVREPRSRRRRTPDRTGPAGCLRPRASWLPRSRLPRRSHRGRTSIPAGRDSPGPGRRSVPGLRGAGWWSGQNCPLGLNRAKANRRRRAAHAPSLIHGGGRQGNGINSWMVRRHRIHGRLGQLLPHCRYPLPDSSSRKACVAAL